MCHQKAYDAITAERTRQQTEEGYTFEHDSGHGARVLILAGRAYATDGRVSWPFNDGWKPTTRVRDLVKAGALFLAARDIAAPGSGTDFQAERLVEATTQQLAAELTAAQIVTQGIAPSPTAYDITHVDGDSLPYRAEVDGLKAAATTPEGVTAMMDHLVALREAKTRTFNEGDHAKLAVRIYRCDEKQAYVGFNSMPGAYSIRVPLSELS